ncbi:Radical SAM domain protein [Ruminiclostridium papyrosolvens DSM 2782]|uniref:Radical SAM domain protein n=1 Tax=Ruminiclostridium papyrosolvens DSM 2782 TaxID=588581 RepID=F1TA10_9FIRM|nr:putative DNA modification/repair radical SAM protein [Ruminiclostridium papyrosolvens]EGD48752.1 Radical SAM domain protein [Ruminiclostridium papyrosolvens DSM 2782]WES32493.1 putative DNA modification/repair radical SAM protein [Ruminiclostridium papyrosolvens DSM 2782]
MDLNEKLGILADAAKYDVSCSSSGGTRKNKNGVGDSHACGICHTWADDGRCVSLLKILLSNECIYDCVYCINRSSNDVPRASFTAEEVIELTMNFYRRNYIEGLFLSSAVLKNPSHTMELMLEIVKKLRNEHGFFGYIHIKAIPGADERLINEAGMYVDRMSVNIELPSDKGLEVLAPQKPKRALLKPMHQISNKIIENKENKRLFKKGDSFVPAGQSTQLIVGATPDKDLSILKLSEALYGNFNLKRVYYSAFVPTVTDPRLPALIKPPLLREHRLYQADWLLRFYGFEADELLSKSNPNFNPELDPKADWAMRNLHMFPIEVNSAEYELLLRVPGIGVKSAQRIITARRVGRLTFDNLKKIGVVLKRAGHFLTCQGKTYDSYSSNEAIVKESLISANLQPKSKKSVLGQMSLFSLVNDSGTDENISEFLLTDSPSNNRQWLSYYNQPQDGRLLLSDIHL